MFQTVWHLLMAQTFLNILSLPTIWLLHLRFVARLMCSDLVHNLCSMLLVYIVLIWMDSRESRRCGFPVAINHRSRSMWNEKMMVNTYIQSRATGWRG